MDVRAWLEGHGLGQYVEVIPRRTTSMATCCAA